MADSRQQPQIGDTPEHRRRARAMRDEQWAFAELVNSQGTVWVCWWNKNRHHDERTAPADLVICSLISGMELLTWLKSHPDWWQIGEWSRERYAAPVQLTDAGRAALSARDIYDMEPVDYGLVEPGWRATPAANEHSS